jgi:nucleolar protein 16
LNDPLNSESEDDEMADDGEGFEGLKDKNEIIKQLEEQASMSAEKRERQQSDREKEWIERLVSKHGENYEKMARDMRANPMQQTAADIKRRVAKWKSNGGTVSAQA